MANSFAAAGFSRPGFVGNDMHGTDREAVIRAIRQFGIGILSPGSAENGTCNQTTSFPGFSSLLTQYGVGVVKHRLTLFVTTDGVSHHRCVVPLIMRHGIGQSIRGKLVVDRTFAAPARVTAG